MTTFCKSLLFLCAFLFAALILWKLPVWGQTPAAGQAKTPNAPPDIAAMNAEIIRLKSIMPSQSHVMADVAIQGSNLWFAAQKKNWPLANYFLGEMRTRIRWMVRIDPMAKEPSGVTDLQGIFDGLDNNTMGAVKEAIDKKDSAQFVTAYKNMLDGCYSCHKSAGRPYLRPMIPTTPAQTIINSDPNAKWPD